MNITSTIIPLLLASTSYAGLVYTADQRSANTIVDLSGTDTNPDTVEFHAAPGGLFSPFAESFSVQDSVAGLGSGSASIEFSSQLGMNDFESTASALSSADRTNATLVFTNAAYLFGFEFHLDSTTELEINANFFSFGEAHSYFHIMNTATNLREYNLFAVDEEVSATERIILAPGDYQAQSLVHAGAIAWVDVFDDTAFAGHSISVQIVPTPPAGSIFALSGFLATRRRW